MRRNCFFYGNLWGVVFLFLGAFPAFSDSPPFQEEALYKEAILEDGSLDKVIDRLSIFAADKNKPRAQRAQALLTASNLYWRYGARDSALASIDEALDIDQTASLFVQKARLLDAAGKASEALIWYEKALPHAGDKIKEKILLRLAMMKAGKGGQKELIVFAQKKDQDFQNGVAVALSLLGFYDQALELYKITAQEGTPAFRQYIRLGEWAIRAKKPKLAGQYALAALKKATLERDRFYGLGILVESHRLSGSLDQVIKYFEGEKNLFPEAYQTWVDLLREKGRFGEALLLFKEHRGDTSSPRMRRQLIRLYKEAGREAEMIVEYRDLIAKEPQAVSWYAALSEYYLGIGKTVEAKELWQDFLRRNKDDALLLLDGAGAMSRMGYEELAVKKLEAHMRRQGVSVPILFFLFELNKEQGQNIEAQEILTRLDTALPPSAAERVELAGAYERLHQPRKALRIWEKLAEQGVGLSYEEKMRLARLYDGQGQVTRAISIWRSLWHEVKSPARRSFIENRLMMLAEENGLLDEMALDLEERLAGGKVDKKSRDLLVNIYSRKQDKISVVEIIDEYFGDEGAVEGLVEQAKIYRLMEDYAGFERINRKLIESDPENKAEYLRAIILGLIDQGDKENITKILDILAALRRVDEEAVGGEFEAGVLALAGFPDAGVEAYRRTMIKDVSNGDNYLLVSDLLKKQDRIDEAIFLLQYVMEGTGEDDLFVVAVDGIMNMVGGRESSQKFQAVLEWTRRLVLERLAAGPNKIYLYRVLAEVSDALNDQAANFAAIENTLSLSETMRSATLRQLVTMVKSASSNQENIARHLAYGRRLVALKEELPPEVYTDLGKVFLEQKDPGAAMKAFNMAIDMTDRTGLLAETAKMFEKADYEDQALEQYSKSLIGDNNNLSVLMTIALLRERRGQKSLANGFFAKALNIILLQLPINAEIEEIGSQSMPGFQGAARKNETVTREYRLRYKTLLQGYLATWPTGSVMAEANVTMLENMLDQEINWLVSGKNVLAREKIRQYSRLDHMVEFIRRVAFATQNYALADKMDRRLLKLFVRDEKFVKSIIRQRVDWGLYGSARLLISEMERERQPALQALLSILPEGKPLLSFARALEAAKESGAFEQVKNISLIGARQDEIMTVAREWAKAGFLIPSVNWAQAHLEGKNYRNLCEYVIRIIRRDPRRLRYSGNMVSDFLLQLEEGAQDRVFSDNDLIKILDGSGRGKNALVRALLAYTIKRASGETSLSFFKKILSETDPRGMIKRVITLWSGLLKYPHAPELSSEMSGLIIRYMEQAVIDRNMVDTITNQFMKPDIHPANIEEAKRVYDAFLQKTGGAVNYFDPIYLLISGKAEAAADVFIKVKQEMGELSQIGLLGQSFFIQSLTAVFLPEHSGLVEKRFDVLEAHKGVDHALIKLRLDLFYGQGNLEVVQKRGAHFLEHIVEKYPENEAYLLRLYSVYQMQGRKIDALEVRQRLFELNPENTDYRTGLFDDLLKLDRPMEALVLNENSSDNMLPPGSSEKRQMMRGNQFMQKSLPGGIVSGAFAIIKDPTEVKKKKLQRAVQAQDEEATRKFLRALWQDVSAIKEEGKFMPGFALSYDGILAMRLSDASQSGIMTGFIPPKVGKQTARIFDSIAKFDFAPSEFEDYLRAMDVENRDNLYALYPFLIKAYQQHGLADQKYSLLNRAVSENNASDEDFTLWLTFLTQGVMQVSPQVTEILDRSLVRYHNFSEYQLMSMARLYAKSGGMVHAVEVYRLLALKLFGVEGETEKFGSPPYKGIFTALGFVDEVNQYLDRKIRTGFIRELIDLVRPSIKGESAQQEAYERFIMTAWDKSLPAPEALHQAEMMIDGGNEERSAGYFFKYARLLLKAGKKEEALNIFRKAILHKSERGNNNFTRPSSTDQNRDYLTRKYGSMLGLSISTGMFGIQNNYFLPQDREELFPASAEKENIAWLSHAAHVLNGWAKDKDAGQLILPYMLFITHQMQEAGAAVAIELVMKDISERLVMQENILPELVLQVIEMSENTGHPLSLALVQKLLLEGRLPSGLMGKAVRRTYEADGAIAARDLGEKAATQTHNDNLLAALIFIAEKSGDKKNIEHWRKIRATEHKAWETLKADKFKPDQVK